MLKFRISTGLVILATLLAASMHAHPAVAAGWQPIAPGIDYQVFQVSGPNNVFVARMERNNPNATLESSIAQGKLAPGTSSTNYGRETVSGMAARYDQALNSWGGAWGNRNRVVVAINGFFFDPNTGIPWSGQVQSSWYVKRFTENQSVSGFAWKMDRSAFIGECVFHPETKQVVTFANGSTQQVDGTNQSRASDQLILYTPQYDTTTPPSSAGVEVLVELTRPAGILPLPDNASGFVREIRKNQGSTSIPFGYIVLSASSTKASVLQNSVDIGDEIGISQNIKSCANSSQFDWTKTYASIGGDKIILKGGAVQITADYVPKPRTAIAYNQDYIFFIVVDGRNPGVSVGMNLEDLGKFAKNTLGATDAVNQDGGGSSTMVVNGEVVNNTYCNFTDCSQNATLGATPEPQGAEPGQPASDESYGHTWSAPTGILEALVANGMMMVAVEPMDKSTTYVPGDTYTAQAQTGVWLGPGTDYGLLSSLPAGSQGVVQADLNHLDGVMAKGSYWWKVKFGSLTGWVPEKPVMKYSIALPFAGKGPATAQPTGAPGDLNNPVIPGTQGTSNKSGR